MPNRVSATTQMHREKMARALFDLENFDNRHNNKFHAAAEAEHRKFTFELREYNRLAFHSRSRIGADYLYLHGMLRHISGGNLKGKRILHLGGSTGVYAHFLGEVEGMKPEVIDLDPRAVKQAVEHRKVTTHRVSAIPIRLGRSPMPLPKGVWLRPNEFALPFPDKRFDYLVSDHFLFSDYHKELGGFEKKEGSHENSFNALAEFNRIMKSGGRLLIGTAHPDVPDMKIFRSKRVIKGFVVEEVFDEAVITNLEEHAKKLHGPTYFILKKVADLKRDRHFWAGPKGSLASVLVHRV